MKKEYLVVAKGLVQGVCFRALVRERAETYGLFGYVTNLKDGSVEICIQGEEEKITSFLESLNQDPGFAKIESFSIDISEIKKLFSSFSIRR